MAVQSVKTSPLNMDVERQVLHLSPECCHRKSLFENGIVRFFVETIALSLIAAVGAVVCIIILDLAIRHIIGGSSSAANHELPSNLLVSMDGCGAVGSKWTTADWRVKMDELSKKLLDQRVSYRFAIASLILLAIAAVILTVDYYEEREAKNTLWNRLFWWVPWPKAPVMRTRILPVHSFGPGMPAFVIQTDSC